MAGGGATWSRSLQQIQRRLEALDARRASAIVLAVACLISTALILVVTRGTTFTTDEWYYLLAYRGFSPGALFHPVNGHLLALPVGLFKLLVATFGARAYLPVRMYSVALTLLTAILVYVIARRRVGPVIALAPSVLLLFFGAGWEVELSPALVPNQLSVIAGLGMLLALERRDGKGDVAACALLIVSLASFTVGLAFAVGAAVELAGRGRRCAARRWWLVGLPLLLYAAWSAWASTLHEAPGHQTPITASAVGSVLSGGADELAAVWAAILGLFRTPGASQLAGQLAIRLDWGLPLAAIFVALALFRFRLAPSPAFRTYTLIAILVTYLALIAVGLGAGRVPNASRYVWMGAVPALVLCVELASGLRIGPKAQAAIWVILGLSLIANVAELRTAGSFFRQLSDYDRAQLGALELVRDRVPPAFPIQQPTGSLLPHYDLGASAGAFFAVSSQFGSPAFTPDELASAPEGPREAADQLIARALRITDVPAPRLTAPAGETRQVIVEREAGTEVQTRHACVLITPQGGLTAVADLQLPAGGLSYSAPPDAHISLDVRRFASNFSIGLMTPRGPGRVAIPTDRSGMPWQARLSATAPVEACPAQA